jgi:hypothetical protein
LLRGLIGLENGRLLKTESDSTSHAIFVKIKYSMLLFIDTEFTGLHQNTTLISLAVIDENNRTFYAEFTDYDKSQLNPFLEEYILPNLILDKPESKNSQDSFFKNEKSIVQAKLTEWLTFYNNRELIFMYDVGMYDWVLFCELFGGALSFPTEMNIDYAPIEFSTILRICGKDSKLPRVNLLTQDERNQLAATGNLHNALYDTKLLKLCFEKLMNNPDLGRILDSLKPQK